MQVEQYSGHKNVCHLPEKPDERKQHFSKQGPQQENSRAFHILDRG